MAIRDENGFELIDHDLATGRTVWSYYDGEKTVYRTDYPVDATLKHNAEMRANGAGQKWGDSQRIASIPPNIYHQHLAEASLQEDHKYISKWLNDGDNAAWRTFEGKV